MFSHQGRPSGWIEVICGPMFSGKTEELIRRLRLAQMAKQRVQIFKPSMDDRYDDTAEIISHTDRRFLCNPVKRSEEILGRVADNIRIVGVDEAQFFDDGIVGVVTKLADRGIRVIVAGLDQDFLGNPFGPMPELLAVAESILKLKAVCMVCGGSATKSQRLTDDRSTVVVGSGEKYQARCRACFDPDLSLENAVPAIPVSRQVRSADV